MSVLQPGDVCGIRGGLHGHEGREGPLSLGTGSGGCFAEGNSKGKTRGKWRPLLTPELVGKIDGEESRKITDIALVPWGPGRFPAPVLGALIWELGGCPWWRLGARRCVRSQPRLLTAQLQAPRPPRGWVPLVPSRCCSPRPWTFTGAF